MRTGLCVVVFWLLTGVMAMSAKATVELPVNATSAPTAEQVKNFRNALGTLPRTAWWEDVDAPTVRDQLELTDLWRRPGRTDKTYVKSAFQAILDHPEDGALVLRAATDLSTLGQEFPAITDLQSAALNCHFAYRDPARGADWSTGDTVAGLVWRLTQNLNQFQSWRLSQEWIERLFTRRRGEINTSLYQLIVLEYADALQSSGHSAEAIQTLKMAQAVPGEWGARLLERQRQYENTLSWKSVAPAVHAAEPSRPVAEQGKPWRFFSEVEYLFHGNAIQHEHSSVYNHPPTVPDNPTANSTHVSNGAGVRGGVLWMGHHGWEWGGSMGYVRGPQAHDQWYYANTFGLSDDLDDQKIETDFVRTLFEFARKFPASDGLFRLRLGGGAGWAFGHRTMSQVGMYTSSPYGTLYSSPISAADSFDGPTWEIAPALLLHGAGIEVELAVVYAAFPRAKSDFYFREFKWSPFGFRLGARF